MPGSVLYFAYGSNMHTGRLSARVTGTVRIEAARLDGYSIRFDKRGQDGSAKCNIGVAHGATVYGVLFEIDRHGLTRLDRIEGRGYRRRLVLLTGLASGRHRRAWCYIAKQPALATGLCPYEWYAAFVAAGAAHNGLPLFYVDALRDTVACSDPNAWRARRAGLELTGRLRSRRRTVTSGVTRSRRAFGYTRS